jgi:NAD(P)-dependent dehydrogenase (short-subunit alcohol dehydrogenase family)
MMETILITGANRGIGLELVRRHRERGDNVIAVCRRASDELRMTGARIIENIDMTDGEAVDGLKDRVEPNSINRVIANAGLRGLEGYENLDFDAILYQYETNAIGPLRLVRALDAAIKDGAKIVLLSTLVASLDDNKSGGEFGYRMSKVALNMAGVNLAHALKTRGITILLLHPGWVRTDLGGEGALVEVAESASKLIATTDRLGIEQTGTFWDVIGGQKITW